MADTLKLRWKPDRARTRARGPYLPSDELVEAVNVALELNRRPLLIRGEPGCGKTLLAHAVAEDLGLDCRVWTVKSTSRARDGLYTYDSVRRLREAHLAGLQRLPQAELEKIDAKRTYVRFGALGEAFLAGEPTVVLIDEIDKADIDFPNDLLAELEDHAFTVEETGEAIVAKHPPIVFITSNDEKDLPDAFLRRCLFHYIEFPSPELLRDIVAATFPKATDRLVEAAVDRFLRLRGQMEAVNLPGKKVSTSELVDWFRMLESRNISPDQLGAEIDRLPFASTLLKRTEDYRHATKKAKP